MGLYPLTGGWSLPLAPICASMAIDHINAKPDILPGYNLRINWRNSNCSDKIALESFIEALRDSNETYIGVFGPGCSVAAVTIANISPSYGLITFTYGAASPSLEDEVRYPYFIRGIVSDTNIAAGRINFINSYDWKRVAIINQQEEIFVYSSYVVQQVLRELDIEYRSETFDTLSVNVATQLVDAVALIKEKGFRIIIANMYEDAAVLFICKLKHSMSPLPYLTWFMIGWYTTGWDENAYEITNGSCTTQDIRDIINGAIGMIPYKRYFEILESREVTISGYTPQELYDTYKQIALDNNIDFSEEMDPVDAYLYDSVWTYALGLNQSISEGHRPEDFDYSNTSFTTAFYENTFSQRFNGWTGNVSYIGRERYEDIVQVLEFINGTTVYRGYYSNIPGSSSLFSNTTGIVTNISSFEVWNKELASDGIEDHFTNIAIFALILVTSILIAIYITVLIIVIIIGVKKGLPPATKSEPLINIVILAGNYINVLLAVLFTIDGKFFPSLAPRTPACIAYCHGQVFLSSVSTSIIYGGMLAKASKYYIIVVKNNFNYTGWLQARYLLLFPAALVLVDTITVISWAVIDPITYQSRINPSGLVDPPFFRTYLCSVTENFAFMIPVTILNLLMILLALFFAYHLRKVVNKSHRYTSVIVWTIYTSIVFYLAVVLTLIFVTDVNIRLGLAAGITNFGAFVMSSIIGLPIVYYLIKDPKGTTFFKSAAKEEYPEDNNLLKLRIAALERDLQTYKDKEAENASGLKRIVNRIRKSAVMSGSINRTYEDENPVRENKYTQNNEKRSKTFAF